MRASDHAFPSLPTEAWNRLEDAIRQFEDAWRTGQRPAIDRFLAGPADIERLALLVELVHADLEFRLKAGEPARVEEYLARHPELGADGTVAWGLVRAEYRLRKACDPEVSLQEYLGRFPQFRQPDKGQHQERGRGPEAARSVREGPAKAGRHAVSGAGADRNLLFGILALQMDFISRDALIAAMHAWVLEKVKPVGQILREQGALGEAEQRLLEAVVERHIQNHGGDASRSLASVSALGSVRQDLEAISDADLGGRLGHVPAGAISGDDPYRTRGPDSVGTPTSTGQRFRILRPHAKGGLGEVFVAHDEELNRDVALKRIQEHRADDRESRGRFLLEAEVTGGLEHPGIVPVYGLGHYADGRPFYAMRFIKGESLREAIERFHQADLPGRDPGERALAFRQLLGRFVDMCNAVAYAHSRGVLHRDLKPGNVMLGPYGETLVVDWGLAKVQEEGRRKREERSGAAEHTLRPASAKDVAATQMGLPLGTPAFMSPEQAAGRLEELGPASDVYGLGATLYSLLTGHAPFSGDVAEVLHEVQRGELVSPRKVNTAVSSALDAVCRKAMAVAPADRYASAKMLADELEHWLADEPVAAYAEPWGALARRWVRRHRALVTGAAAALVVAALSLGGATAVLARTNERLAAANHAEEEARADATRERDEAQSQRDRALQAERTAQANATKAEQKAAEAKAVLAFFQNKVLAAARPKGVVGGLGKDATIRAALDAAEPTIATTFTGQPTVEAAIRNTLGESYRYLGELPLARVQLERGLELRTRALGGEHPDVAESLNSLAIVYSLTGQLKKAEPLYRRSLEIREAKLGKDHVDVADSLNNLALFYRATGQLPKAEPLYRRSLEIYQTRLGKDHPKVAGSLHNLANLYRDMGDLPKAESLLRQSLEIREGKYGRDHPEVADSLNNLANLYDAMGQLSKAEPLYRRSLEIYEAKLDRDHPYVAGSMHNLADVYMAKGELAKAEELFRRSLKIREAKLGKDHLDVAWSLLGLATVAGGRGEPAKAEPLWRRCLAIRQAKLGPEHSDTLDSQTGLGDCLVRQGKGTEAEPLLRQCWEGRRKKEPDGWSTFEAEALLGAALLGQKKYADAEQLLLQGYEGIREREAKIPAFEKRRLTEAVGRLVELYDAWGKKEQADEWRQKQQQMQTPAPPAAAKR
jgi:tetratricopeptide (TPR) repeat protein/tRNA A-37 threonylcarbamoyl transferase component Bud32